MSRSNILIGAINVISLTKDTKSHSSCKKCWEDVKSMLIKIIDPAAWLQSISLPQMFCSLDHRHDQ